jgi:MtN3 and saliva related transmembrane protein
MNPSTIIGLGAAVLSTVSVLPQLVKIVRTNCVKEISNGMWLIMCNSVTLWVTYGVLVGDVPIVAGNVLVYIQAAAILMLKKKYSYREYRETTIRV